MLGSVVELIWVDSSSDYGWLYDRVQEQEATKVYSAGILVGASEQCATITTSIVLGGGGVNTALDIPWCAILYFKQLYKAININ